MSNRDKAREWLIARGVHDAEDHPDTLADLTALLDRTAAEARDWSKMAPQEAWEHLSVAPKVAGPWESHIGYSERRDVNGAAVVTDWGVTSGVTTIDRDDDGRPRSVRAFHITRAEADAALRAAGWVLVDEEACGAYLGDNDGTCPQLTCIRAKGHEGHCDNVRGDGG